MAGKRLVNAMVEHDGKCFYCGDSLPIDRASVDHIVPKALGGANNPDNRVYCCVSINRLFGCTPLKHKLKWLLARLREKKRVCPDQ